MRTAAGIAASDSAGITVEIKEYVGPMYCNEQLMPESASAEDVETESAK